MRQWKSYAMVAGAALMWGLAATVAKVLLVREVDTVFLVQTRATFSALFMACLLAVTRPGLLRVRAGDLWRMAAFGIVGIAGSNFTYYYVIREATVAVAILLQYTAPLLVMMYAAFTGEEEFTGVKIIGALLAIAGCYCAVGGIGAPSNGLTAVALLMGLLSAVCFAFMTVFTRHLLARYSVYTVTFYALAFASCFWLVVNPPWRIVMQKTSSSLWLALAGFAVISVLLPHTLFFSGLRHVVPSRAIIISTLEPVVAISTAALVIGEGLTSVQLAGALLVIAAIVIVQIRREKGGEELREGRDASG